MMEMSLVALSGGIGSGKSVVSRMLEALGYEVYDCDSNARRLMNSSGDIKKAVRERFGPEVFTAEGKIDRKLLAGIVFADSEALEDLNRIVHGAVRNEIESLERKAGKVRFVETAILYQSGLDRMVDEVWEITAPRELRIERVMKRSGMTEKEVKSRIEAQDAFEVDNPHRRVRMVINDGVTPLLPQIEKLLAALTTPQ